MSRSLESSAGASGRAVAGYLLSALIALNVMFGGSLRGADLVTASLEMLACFVLVWCIVDPRLNAMRGEAWWFLLIIGIGCLAAVLQLVPLPHEVWSTLPGRADVVEGFRLLDVGRVDQPISLAPDQTLSGLLRILPPLAVFVLAAKLPWQAMNSPVRSTIIGLAAVSVALGLAQLVLREHAVLFPYGPRNVGQAAGIFEVVNHQATLQLMALPFVGVWFGRLSARFSLGDEPLAEAVVMVAAFLVLVTGVVLSGSVAGLALLVPVALVSGLLVLNARPSPQALLGALVLVIALIGVMYLVLTSPIVGQLGITDFSDGPLSRRSIYEHTLPLIADHFPVGAGLGSFEAVFPGYEAQASITAQYISHAHNDYLEVAAELGLAGCLVLIGLVGWWVVLTVRAWRAGREDGGKLKRAASIALGVVFLHSLVDSPVRTEAVASLAALCFGILCSARRERVDAGAPEPADIQPVFRHKHVEI